MTREDKKNWLSRYRKYYPVIRQARSDLDSMTILKAVQYDQVKSDTNAHSDLSDVVARREELIAECHRTLYRGIELFSEILHKIETLDDDRQKDILHCYYLLAWSIDRMEDEFELTARWVYKEIGKAVDALEFTPEEIASC